MPKFLINWQNQLITFLNYPTLENIDHLYFTVMVEARLYIYSDGSILRSQDLKRICDRQVFVTQMISAAEGVIQYMAITRIDNNK